MKLLGEYTKRKTNLALLFEGNSYKEFKVDYSGLNSDMAGEGLPEKHGSSTYLFFL